MLSKFFIERPIFANVIAIVTLIVGAVTGFMLPIEQYPEITPPTVQVSAIYPGADAVVLSDTVAGPIEQEINGVEGMLYLASTCSSNGVYTLTVTFEVGTDLDQAQVLVQNRVQVAMPRLPEEVQRQGVQTKKQSTNIVLVPALISPNGKYDDLYLSNFATLRVKDALTRVPGVGDVQVIGGGTYGMRIWVNPDALKSRNLTMGEVLLAIREQNVQVAAGQVGAYPSPKDQGFQYNVVTQGRLSDPKEFEKIIVKTSSDDRSGMRITRIKDIAKVELGAQTYDQWCEIKGQAAASLLVYQLPGANALSVARDVRKRMDELQKTFPEGIKAIVPFDTTIFVDEAIWEVYKTLFEAGFLVLVVILVFLQDWRAMLIPATTVPVTLIGAFAAMAALGFSINMLTLFGLVLAIGIVVDDAIVIVENAVHHIDHGKLDPKTATIKAMSEVIGPIMGITLVLMAVFLPTAFLGGITGQLYRQFALTIAATAAISAINAVTLKPAQCAVYLRPSKEKKNPFYRAFNRAYQWTENRYMSLVGASVKQPAIVMAVFLGLVVLTGWWFMRLPTGFVPTEDQGYAIIAVRLPDAASQQRTRDIIKDIDKILGEAPGVESWFLIGGMSIMDQSTSSNTATMFITYKPFAERSHHPEQAQMAIIGGLYAKFNDVREAVVLAFPPPGIRGLGVAGGFKMQIEDRTNVGLVELQNVAEDIVSTGNTQTGLDKQLQTSFRARVPQIYVNVDKVKAKSLGIDLNVLYGTLQASLGSAYVNDFNKFNKTYQVRVQADQKFRMQPEDIRRLEVRNRDGKMIPVGSVATVNKSLGPQVIPRYNLYPTAAVSGAAAPGYSSGEALQIMEQIAAKKLPDSMGYDWTDMSFQEKRVGSQAIYVFILAVLMVYLVLAALYESWTMPAAVIMVVPLALLGTVIAVAVSGQDNNIYTQIGIVLIISLASKNAILIVEFARELRKHGRTIVEASLEASRLRFRPILMTSFAFILGIVPLVFAHGAGAASRRALGTAVFGGMIAATVLAVFFVPVFYVLMQRLAEMRRVKKSPPPVPVEEPKEEVIEAVSV